MRMRPSKMALFSSFQSLLLFSVDGPKRFNNATRGGGFRVENGGKSLCANKKRILVNED